VVLHSEEVEEVPLVDVEEDLVVAEAAHSIWDHLQE
jgi:hypothetical protein